MVTLLPALLVIFGRWMFWPKRPAFGSPEPTSTGFWARVGSRIAPRPRTVWVGHRRSLLGDRLPGPVQARRQRPVHRGQPTPRSSTRSPARRCSTEPRPGRQLQHRSRSSPTPTRPTRSRRRWPASTASASPTDRQPIEDGVALLRGHRSTRDVASQPAFDIVEAVARRGPRRRRCRRPGRRRRRRSTSTPRPPRNRDNKVIIPIVLLVVLLILMLLLRALASPLILIGTVVLSFGAALGHLGAAVQLRLRLRRVRRRRSRCSRSCSWSPWASTTTSS